MKYFLGLLVASHSWAMGDFQVSAGYHHSCALDIEGVKCWGDNGSGQTNVQPLKNPLQVSAGGEHTCALDLEGVKCWGFNPLSNNVPQLKDPMQVSAGKDITCVWNIKDEVECWQYWNNVHTFVYLLKNPLQVSAGYYYSCALDMVGVKCWTNDPVRSIEVPQLKEPTQVSVGYDHSCALDMEGVQCWGNNKMGQSNVPQLKKPIQVSAGNQYTCALDMEGVKCWGDNYYGQTNVPPLKNPTQVSAGDGHTCALDLEGVKCWGDNHYGQIDVPELFFDIISYVVHSMTSARSEYTKAIHKFIRNEDLASATQYFEFLLVSPVVLSTDSQIFTDRVISVFLKEKIHLYTILGYHEKDEGLSEIPDTDKTRTLAIISIKSASLVGLNFLETNMRTNLLNTITVADLALSSPMNNQKISDLLVRVDSMIAEKQKLKSSLKSAFLVDSMELAANWLRGKVK